MLHTTVTYCFVALSFCLLLYHTAWYCILFRAIVSLCAIVSYLILQYRIVCCCILCVLLYPSGCLYVYMYVLYIIATCILLAPCYMHRTYPCFIQVLYPYWFYKKIFSSIIGTVKRHFFLQHDLFLLGCHIFTEENLNAQYFIIFLIKFDNLFLNFVYVRKKYLP